MTRYSKKQLKYLRAAARAELPWLAIKQKGLCHYCKTPIKIGFNASVEHIRPLGDGGNNHPRNLVAACIPCNYQRNHEYTLWLTSQAKQALIEAIQHFIVVNTQRPGAGLGNNNVTQERCTFPA